VLINNLGIMKADNLVTKTGGVRAQYQLRETLIAMQAYVVPGPEVVVGGVHTKFKR
jgi:NAD(P)H-dependent FMN reductase